MTDHDEDAIVRDSMRALREHDAAAAPSFARVRQAAMRRVDARPRGRRALAWTSTVAIAAALLLAIWLGRSRPTLGPAPSFAETEPLAFLLAPPSASVVSAGSPVRGSW